MRIVVAGGAGGLGQALAAGAADRPGVQLIAATRAMLDLERPATLAPALAELAPDLVINAAAFTGVDTAEGEAERAWRTNADGAGALARAARAAGAPMIQISTDYVFDGEAGHPYAEGDRTHPLNAYGRGKLGGEEAVRKAHPDHLIVRTAWLLGPYGRNFLRTILDRIRAGAPLAVVADQRGSPTFTPELADALLAIATDWRATVAAAPERLLHVAGREPATWHSLAARIADAAAGRGLPRVPVEAIATRDRPTPAARPSDSTLDSSLAARVLRWSPRPWRESVDATVGQLLG